MSTARRAYDLLRGYVHEEWERIQGLERADALDELQDAIDASKPTYKPPAERAERRTVEDATTLARGILGVPAGASFSEVRKNFERLNTRSDPSRFPANSPEASEAAEIQKRVHWAYSILCEGVDDTQKRFSSLEIE
jgi:hypothetical protein